MRKIIGLIAFAALALACALAPIAATVAAERHILWSVQGRNNTVYLLGSVHFLSPAEELPAVIDSAYQDSEALVMEIDMDDLTPLEMQQATLELGMLPPDQSLAQLMDAAAYRQVAAKASEAGMDPALLDRFQPWLAGITLVQLHLMKMGLDPTTGIEQRMTARATQDGKEIRGLETLREQFGLLANLPIDRQCEFLMYSVEDTERATKEVEDLLGAWRSGNTARLEQLLAEGFQEYPDLYRPLTIERNRRWIADIEALLGERRNYLVIVGALHLVGKDSVVDLLERKGYEVVQQ